MRRIVSLGLVVSAILLIAAPVSAATDTGASDDAKRASQQAQNKRVCKRVKVTGTHFARRICRSQREWDEMQRQNEEDMDRVMTSNPHEIPVDNGAPAFGG